MLKVLSKFEGNVNNLNLDLTRHFQDRASTRLKSEPTNVQDMFIVEKDGVVQLHIILSNATIVVVDKVRGKIVTLLNARPTQIKRYYTKPERAPQWLLEIAESNKVCNLNN